MNKQLRSEPLKLYAGYILLTKPCVGYTDIKSIPYNCYALASTPKHIIESNDCQRISKEPGNEGYSISVRLVEVPFENIRQVYESQMDVIESGD